jgi:hypothetical protein
VQVFPNAHCVQPQFVVSQSSPNHQVTRDRRLFDDHPIVPLTTTHLQIGRRFHATDAHHIIPLVHSHQDVTGDSHRSRHLGTVDGRRVARSILAPCYEVLPRGIARPDRNAVVRLVAANM